MSKSLAIVTGSILAVALAVGASVYAADQNQTQNQEQAQVQEQDQGSEACQQCRQERQRERLEQAVKDNVITQEEAGEIQEWWNQKPEAMNKLKGDGFGPKHRFGKGPGPCSAEAESN